MSVLEIESAPGRPAYAGRAEFVTPAEVVTMLHELTVIGLGLAHLLRHHDAVR